MQLKRIRTVTDVRYTRISHKNTVLQNFKQMAATGNLRLSVGLKAINNGLLPALQY